MVRTLNIKFAVLTTLCVCSHRIKNVQNTVWQILEPAHLANIKQLYPPRQQLPRTLRQPWAAMLLFSFSMNVTGGGHGNPLQHSSLENPLDRGAWWVTVRRITESDTTEAAHTHTCNTYMHKWLHVSSFTRHLSCCVWLTGLNTASSGFIHAVAGVAVAFLFKAESCICHIVFVHLSIYRYVGDFYLLVIMNNAAIGSGIARHMVTLCLIFGGSEYYFF